jgi:hypothetical protein
MQSTNDALEGIHNDTPESHLYDETVGNAT